MAINFNKFAQEGNEFLKNLADGLGHPDEDGRTGIILRAVMHTLRERITISESMHLLAQLPLFLKGVYVEGWKYREKPQAIESREDFMKEVEQHQAQYGERQFQWDKSTEEIVKIVLHHLGKYISGGEFDDITAQMPEALKGLILESREM
jgi:uncharacterized protein (DUF2267 family)